ncbi:MAG: DNA repair protein RadC [Ignavibacteriales bacterium]|nr:DNA repair protein RadC [Ignavibacteriales bacterium]
MERLPAAASHDSVVSYHPKIKDWPEEERPREKMARHGAGALTDAELLAIMIGSGSGNVTAVDLAKTLMVQVGSLRDLASLDVSDLLQKKIKGLGSARVVTLVAVFEIARRIRSSAVAESAAIRSPDDVAARYIPQLQSKKQELFMVLVLNSANKITREVVVTQGLLNSSLAHPREVFRPAILENAASVILLHNHPSGNPEPSGEDIAMTRQLVEAGKLIGITVHDHIIIAGDTHTSFAERGLL